MLGQTAKRLRQHRAIVMEKKRRLDSGEELKEVKDEFDFGSSEPEKKRVKSTTNVGGELNPGQVVESIEEENPFGSPEDEKDNTPSEDSELKEEADTEDVEMGGVDDEKSQDPEADVILVKFFLADSLRNAMRDRQPNERATAWKDFDELMHLFGDYVPRKPGDRFLYHLKVLRDEAQVVLDGAALPLSKEVTKEKK